MATLNSRISVSLTGTLASSANLTSDQAALSLVQATVLANGVGAAQADSLYTQKAVSIAGAGTLSIDIRGALVDALGNAFAPVKLRAVYIYSYAANTTNLTLLGDANTVPILNTAATTLTLRPGGTFLVTDVSTTGIAVTAGTGDILKLVNAAGAAALVDIILIGTSS